MTSSLIKLIDYALLPLVLIILGKVLGVYVVSALFGVELGVSQGGSYLPFQPAVPAQDLQTVSSYSDLFMFAVIATGFSFILVSALKLHDTHIDVKTVTMLAKFNLLSLMKTTYELYHAGAIWIIFVWLATAVILLNALTGATYWWVFVFALVFSLSTTIALLRDLFAEINAARDAVFKRGYI
ncbi:MAG: hypothetical protein TR69_WS6001000425 [candidate division WS6 bacterium OLB20]|uniref:Uncharacterized protein n=1 Tax=candidate division WS6 bacterium OLB20 TaxID=1617426 RepID=A0A136LXP2_9BACT|nr:MAG: hypothetical protein TR69_WS6001000425 [candidate division WS6 bacterium OLB20]